MLVSKSPNSNPTCGKYLNHYALEKRWVATHQTVNFAVAALEACKRALVPAAVPSPPTLTAVVQTLTRSRASFDLDVGINLSDEYQVKVDILSRAHGRLNALMVVEHSPYEKVTTRRADHTFAVHSDLNEAKWRGKRFSIVDDQDLRWIGNSDSFLRLGRISELISTSELDKSSGYGFAD